MTFACLLSRSLCTPSSGRIFYGDFLLFAPFFSIICVGQLLCCFSLLRWCFCDGVVEYMVFFCLPIQLDISITQLEHRRLVYAVNFSDDFKPYAKAAFTENIAIACVSIYCKPSRLCVGWRWANQIKTIASEWGNSLVFLLVVVIASLSFVLSPCECVSAVWISKFFTVQFCVFLCCCYFLSIFPKKELSIVLKSAHCLTHAAIFFHNFTHWYIFHHRKRTTATTHNFKKKKKKTSCLTYELASIVNQ